MSEAEKDSKTEAPTEKKIRDALEKGQTAFSREAPIFASLLAATGFLALFGSAATMKITERLSYFMRHAHDIRLDNGHDALNSLVLLVSPLLTVLIPLFAILMLAGFIASAAQNAPRLVRERIIPKISNISLSNGLKRILGKRGFIEFGKSLAKICFAFLVVIFFMRNRMQSIVGYLNLDPLVMLDLVRNNIVFMFSLVCGFMAVVTAIDVFAARILWFDDIRMTHQEIKDEIKQAEGDPLMKGRLRSLLRSRSRNRMMKDVETATLIIANPTHYSIALRYDPHKDAAPVVIAKGTDELALRIRAVAEKNGILVFEQVALARSLYKSVKIGQIIPQEFYKAVAELIRYIYSRK
jgi:flagellar biosynthesis protein FlhB